MGNIHPMLFLYIRVVQRTAQQLDQKGAKRMSECTDCDGTGKFYPCCDTCDGRGLVNDASDECPECENEPCSSCAGTGEE